MRFRFYDVSCQVSICWHFQHLVNSFLNCFYKIGNYANNILIAVKWKMQFFCLTRVFFCKRLLSKEYGLASNLNILQVCFQILWIFQPVVRSLPFVFVNTPKTEGKHFYLTYTLLSVQTSLMVGLQGVCYSLLTAYPPRLF